MGALGAFGQLDPLAIAAGGNAQTLIENLRGL